MPSADNASAGLRRVTDDDVERPVISTTGHDPGVKVQSLRAHQRASPGSLLDINNLLELARLIEKIREDGRLNGELDDYFKHPNIQCGNHLKD